MTDQVLSYGVQYGACTAAAMGLSEWATLPLGQKGHTRKRWNALLWSHALNGLSVVSGFSALPKDTIVGAIGGVVLMSLVCVGTAHGIVHAKKTLWDGDK